MNQWIAKFRSLVKRVDRSHKSSFFRNRLTNILFIACIPGLITGLCIYWMVTGKVESELQKLHQNQMMQQSQNIDDQFSYLELTFSHWAFDPKFDQKLKDIDFVYKYDQVQELYRTLLVIEGSHPLIDKVELYLDKPYPLVMNKEKYTSLTDKTIIEHNRTLLKMGKSIFWSDAFQNSDKGKTDNAAITLINKLPGGSLEPFGILVAQLNKEKLIKMLNTLTPYNEGSTFLMTGDDRWFITSSGHPSDLDSALRNEYIKRGEKTDSFLFKYNNITYSVSSGQFTRLGTTWMFVSAAPLTFILTPVIFISKFILVISLGGIFLALLLSWLAMNRMYSPIQRLLHKLTGEKGVQSKHTNKNEFELIEKEWNNLTMERETLHNRLERQMPLVREGFLLQLVQGYLFSLTENEMRERFKHFGWEVESQQFIVMIIQLRGLSSPKAGFSLGDEELVAFAAANIIEELAANQAVRFEVLNFHDLSVGLFIMIPLGHSTAQIHTELHSLSQELIQVINRILKLQVTVTISKTTTQVKHIPYLFEEARHALSYRDLLETNQIIDLEQLNKSDAQREFSYPFSLEKEIIHSIRMGSENDAAVLIEQFLSELSRNGSTELIIHHGMLQLLGSIQHGMLDSGMNPVKIFEGVNLFEQLSGMKEPEKILEWFQYKVVGVFVHELISKQDFHLKQMVEKVIVFLKEHYMTEFSLESCADQFGTSPYTLSRAFKLVAGINFIDYLTNVRMENAREMLRQTDLKISDVAERVGYQHTYFNRIFKKYEGVTPSQYREMSRNLFGS